MESQIRTLSVYMTDMSFETNTKIAHYHPESNLEKERHVDVKVNRVQGFLPSKSIFQVVLTHTLQLNETVSGHERHVGEVSYAGNFEIEGMPGHQADRFLNVDYMTCFSMLAISCKGNLFLWLTTLPFTSKAKRECVILS
jgi:preprotein translocase subunit SecB